MNKLASNIEGVLHYALVNARPQGMSLVTKTMFLVTLRLEDV